MNDEETPPPSLTIELREPIELKGGKYTEIRLREPKASEVRKAETHMRSSVNVETIRLYQIVLVSLVSGVPEPVIEGMAISQFNEAYGYLARFLEGGTRIGVS